MAFDTAISGMQAASAELDVIGNNIANSSTTGFKLSRAEFADVYATSVLGVSDNAIGKGVTLSAVTQGFSQGNLSFTSNSLDLAINGDGFFMLSENGANSYTRAGNFQVDEEGFIVAADGAKLQAYQANEAGDVVGIIDDLKVLTSLIDPNATSALNMTANFDSREEIPVTPFTGTYDAFATPPTFPDTDSFNASSSTTVYDGLGNPHNLDTYFVKSATANQWDTYTLIDGVSTSGPEALTFLSNGQLDPVSLPATINISTWTPLDADGAANGAAVADISIDLSTSTQFGSPFGVSSLSQDGYSAGELSSVDVDGEGVVFTRYTNGQARALGQVVLAGFNSNGGLQPSGNTRWLETFSSGPATISTPGTAGLGVVQSGALEDSNVEITEQLVNMIVAQRNFQASAQVIQTEDTVTQTIINMR